MNHVLKILIQEVVITESKFLGKMLKCNACLRQGSFSAMRALFDMYFANHFEITNIIMENLPCMKIFNHAMFIIFC